jgi:hypothetical protein
MVIPKKLLHTAKRSELIEYIDDDFRAFRREKGLVSIPYSKSFALYQQDFKNRQPQLSYPTRWGTIHIYSNIQKILSELAFDIDRIERSTIFTPHFV